MRFSLGIQKNRIADEKDIIVNFRKQERSNFTKNIFMFITLIIIGFVIILIQMYLTFGFELLVVILLVSSGKLVDFFHEIFAKRSILA